MSRRGRRSIAATSPAPAASTTGTLVDVSAPAIVGAYLLDRDRAPLFTLAKSSSLWERRIAIISTLFFIRHDQFDDTLRIAEILLDDGHDLIHKATGWMLREVGKRDQPVLERFLRKHARRMPRTMLRYDRKVSWGGAGAVHGEWVGRYRR